MGGEDRTYGGDILMKRLLIILAFLPLFSWGQNLDLTTGEYNFSNITSGNSFAEIHLSEADTISTATTNYYAMGKFILGQYNDASLAGDSGVVINQNGTYQVVFNISFSHSSAVSTLCHYSIFKNGVEDTSMEGERTVSTQSAYGNISVTGMLTITNAPDTVQIKAKASNSGDMISNHSNLNLVRIK